MKKAHNMGNLDIPSNHSHEKPEQWKGKVVTAQFSDGEDWNECEDEDCFCPNPEQRVLPAGTYITVKLDEDYGIGCFPVTIFPEARK